MEVVRGEEEELSKGISTVSVDSSIVGYGSRRMKKDFLRLFLKLFF